MLRIFLLLSSLWCCGCTPGSQSGLTNDQLLTYELADRQAADSLIQDYFGRHMDKLPIANLVASRDSVFNDNCSRLKELFLSHGLLILLFNSFDI